MLHTCHLSCAIDAVRSTAHSPAFASADGVPRERVAPHSLAWLVVGVLAAIFATSAIADPSAARRAESPDSQDRPTLALSIAVDGQDVALVDDDLVDWLLDADGVVERRGRRALAEGLVVEWTYQVQDRRGNRNFVDSSETALATGGAIVVLSNLLLINTTGFALPIGPALTTSLGCIPQPTLGGASVIGALTDLGGNGTFVSTIGATSMFTALIDGVPVFTMLDAPYMIATQPFASRIVGPSSVGNPIPSLPLPPVVATASIEYDVLLGAGGASTFYSAFIVQ